MASAIRVTLLCSVLILISMVLLANCAPGSSTTNERCKLSTNVPNMDELLKQKKNIASPNDSHLANLVGYLYFYNKGYLPFVLSGLDVDDKRILLTSECANLYWDYQLDPFSKAGLIVLNLDMPDDDLKSVGFKVKHTCSFETAVFFYENLMRLSCSRGGKAVCRTRGDDGLYEDAVAELVIGSLELELMGSLQAHKNGQFNKPPIPSSDELFLFRQDT